MSSSQGPCLNDAVCEYKNPLLLETWPQPLERANPYYCLVPGSSGMRFVQHVVNREGREVSARLRHAQRDQGHRCWVGMEPQETCPLVRIQASYISVTNMCVEGGDYLYHWSSAVLGALSSSDVDLLPKQKLSVNESKTPSPMPSSMVGTCQAKGGITIVIILYLQNVSCKHQTLPPLSEPSWHRKPLLSLRPPRAELAVPSAALALPTYSALSVLYPYLNSIVHCWGKDRILLNVLTCSVGTNFRSLISCKPAQSQRRWHLLAHGGKPSSLTRPAPQSLKGKLDSENIAIKLYFCSESAVWGKSL